MGMGFPIFHKKEVTIDLVEIQHTDPALDKKTRTLTTTKKTFPRHLEMGLGGGWAGCPPRLMPGINRGGHFLLTEVVTINRLAKTIYGDG
jgi:hypothetical protein